MAVYTSIYDGQNVDASVGRSYVPTLQSAPTGSTKTFSLNGNTVNFEAGQFARVAVTGGYDFYQLKDVSGNTATWEKVADTNTIPQGYCDTSSSTRDKVVTCTDYAATANSYIMILMKNANSYSTNNSTIRLNINGTGNKTVYINGTSSSSSSNKTLPAGSYLVFYDGTNYYFRTDGKITGNITGDAATVNGKTVGVNVPANAVFTDTTYTTMGASGSGHKGGLVPDPGSTAGTTKFLREDGTWQVPTADVSAKEDKMSIVLMIDEPISTLSPAVNTLYMVPASTLDVTLPTITDTTKVQSFVIMLSFVGNTASVTIHGTQDNICIVYMPTDISLEQYKIYEINCMFFGQDTVQPPGGQSFTVNNWSVAIRDIGETNLE